MNEPAVTQDRIAEVLGTKLFYRECPAPDPATARASGSSRAGAADAQSGGAGTASVLYLHGNLGSCKWYERVMCLPGVRTLALDMPNFGRSEHIPQHDIRTYSEYVTAFIREVAGGPVVLVGHSLGGSVAMGVACETPDLVVKLVLVDPAPVEGLVTPPAHYPVIDAYRTDEVQLRAALKTVVPTLTDDTWFDEMVADARRMKGDAYVGHAEELGKANFSALAGRATASVLVIRGGQDWLVTQEMAQRTAEAFGGEVREFPTVGHSVMAEDPALFRDALVEFITGP